MAALPPAAARLPAPLLPSWASTAATVWGACVLLLAGLLAAATLCQASAAQRLLALVDIFTTTAAFWRLRVKQASWGRPLPSSSPLGGACSALCLATIFSLAFALLLRRSEDNTLSREGLSIFRSSTWAALQQAPWGASPALPTLLPSGLLVSLTAVGEAGACSRPLQWAATAPSHGSGSWVLQGGSSSSAAAAAASPAPAPALSNATLVPASFSLLCAGCGLGWGDSLTFTLPYSCQGLVLEAGAVGADGTLDFASRALPPPPRRPAVQRELGPGAHAARAQ